MSWFKDWIWDPKPSHPCVDFHAAIVTPTISGVPTVTRYVSNDGVEHKSALEAKKWNTTEALRGLINEAHQTQPANVYYLDFHYNYYGRIDKKAIQTEWLLKFLVNNIEDIKRIVEG